MKTRPCTPAATGPLMLDLRVSHGTVRVVVEDRDRAEVTVTGPAADVDRTRVDEAFQRFSVHVPDATVRQHFGSVHTSGGGSTFTIGAIVSNGVMQVGGDVHGLVVGAISPPHVEVDARLPLGSSIFIETVGASVVVDGPLLTADVGTTSGAIYLGTVAGPRLRSVSGRVVVAELIGAGAIETVSGDIDVAATKACDLNARSVSGDIRAVGPIRLAASTVSGRILNY